MKTSMKDGSVVIILDEPKELGAFGSRDSSVRGDMALRIADAARSVIAKHGLPTSTPVMVTNGIDDAITSYYSNPERVR